MALKIVKFEAAWTRFALIAVGVIFILLTWYFIKWNFLGAVAARGFDSKVPESRSLADLVLSGAPDDPMAHYAAAVYLEKTFEINDFERSLVEYEKAVAASPDHFYFWLALGRARDRNGDQEGAEKAFAEALRLAPNYAQVQWAYGNALIRHGKTSEGFSLIAKAAASDHQYSNPAASVAMQIFEGDVEQVRRALGDSPETNGSLADILVGQKFYAGSVDAWSHLTAEEKTGRFKNLSQKMLTILNDAHQVRLAARVYGDLFPDNAKSIVGQVTDGSFEAGLKFRDAGIFEWQIGEGSDPQVSLSDGARRTGKYSLWLTFNSFETAAFRTISQRVAVEPGVPYRFQAFYRADLKTKAIFKWEVIDATSGAQLAVTEPLAFAGDWTTLSAEFTVPPPGDGVVIRLVRLGCTSGACPVTGKAAFDDISIERVQK